MLDFKELSLKLEALNIPKFRAKQISDAVYKQGKTAISDINVLPKDLRESLSKTIQIFSLKLLTSQESKDKKTIKALFETNDKKKIEAVLMNFNDNRATVCVSSQIGCKLGCKFCATGKMGFFRDLTSEEITDQILYFQAMLLKKNKRITNIVFMGMGEPFLNYENVTNAIRNLNDPATFNIGARNITVSTSGIPDGIRRFADENWQVNLAVSLHAPTQELRESIMPVAKMYSLDTVMDAVNYYLNKTNRRVSYEYILIKGINDNIEDAKRLCKLLKHQLCHINLIPYNANDIDGFGKPTKDRIEKFKKILEDIRLPVTVRVSLGDDIKAACGQLANQTKK